MKLFLEEIQRQPRHVREIMFAFCVVITISLVGMIWFRSFEEDLFVLMNPDPEKQNRFYAERSQREPTMLAAMTKTFGSLQANFYSALGLFDSANSKEIKIEEEYKGKVNELPLSADK